jgi:hypothetical protein
MGQSNIRLKARIKKKSKGGESKEGASFQMDSLFNQEHRGFLRATPSE